MKKTLKVPLFVALDMDEKSEALKLAKELKPYVGGYKIGPRLVLKYGEELIRELSEIGPVFVDNKFYDIPNTMEHAVRSAFNAGAAFATVHASAGKEALTSLAELEKELNAKRPFKILAVTVLTSFSDDTLPANWKEMPINDQVASLAEEVFDSGLTGMVCSAHEASLLREKFPEAYLVTPGIRFMNESQGDQKRVMGPKEAIEAGASSIVVGRPIYQAKDPVAAAKSYFACLCGE